MAVNLKKRTVVITRPAHQSAKTAQLIKQFNGQSIIAPLLSIQPPQDPKPLASALDNLDRYDAILFTSANGAQPILDRWPTPPDTMPPLYAIGEKSAESLRKAGYTCLTPDHGPSNAESLARFILSTSEPKQIKRFLFLRAEQGKEILTTLLTEAGHKVNLVFAYRTSPAESMPEAIEQTLQKEIVPAVLLLSLKTAENFLDLLRSSHAADTAFTCLINFPFQASLFADFPNIQIIKNQSVKGLLAEFAKLT
ncbi:MAG: uroporphyrinogen-III synthase [Magnetococcales bacterium]|nr:uroporphyrinogen-III synthase [Magnetococcales bacterium]